MGLTFQWFGRDPLSPVSETYEILQSDFLMVIKDFYDLMMFPKDQKEHRTGQEAWKIHKFLMTYPDILFKQFLFFHQNIDNNPWMISCMCNPWFFLFKEKKKFTPDSLPEAIEAIEINEFIHGWLMFDPFYRFWSEAALFNKMVAKRDLCIWCLNMAFM